MTVSVETTSKLHRRSLCLLRPSAALVVDGVGEFDELMTFVTNDQSFGSLYT